MKRKSFTLIELVVVIAIMAILAAIIVPVFMEVHKAVEAERELFSNIDNAKMVRTLQRVEGVRLDLYGGYDSNDLPFNVCEIRNFRLQLLEERGFTQLPQEPNDPNVWWVRKEDKG